MPLGFERRNERTTRPNALINFIKPLPGPDAHVAEDFLARIAAQCYPVMKRNYIAVMALEEYENNPEFIGRNFNAGEVIQLVLKARDGSWLPFKHVQMVMMHELAHCKQMNHSKAFWAVRNGYADEMKELWSKSYLGEGLWGRGKHLNTGAFIHNTMPDTSLLPEHLCGGTYRSGRGSRKRRRGVKAEPTMTYAERQQKRILRRFGAGGTAVGDDKDTRIKLESGVSKQSKPRVAKSKRGRELRAAAALARFEKAKDEDIKREESLYGDTDSDDDWPAMPGQGQTDPTCRSLEDSRGLGFVKVCEDEDRNDEDAIRERMEMLDITGAPSTRPVMVKEEEAGHARSSAVIKVEDDDDTMDDQSLGQFVVAPTRSNTILKAAGRDEPVIDDDSAENDKPIPRTRADDPIANSRPTTTVEHTQLEQEAVSCSACTMANAVDAVTCLACMNVLAPEKMPNSWRCESASCNGSYTKIADYGRCTLCQAPKLG